LKQNLTIIVQIYHQLVKIKILIKSLALYHLSQQSTYLREYPKKNRKYKKITKEKEQFLFKKNNKVSQCQINKL